MYETLLLISQAVKSGVPLSSAIRLTIGSEPQRRDKAFLKLATLLDKGIEPKVAAAQSGLPTAVVDLLDTALTSEDFAGTFDELAKLEISRSLTIHRVLQALAYPTLLFVGTVLCFWQLLVITVPQFEAIFNDFDTTLPAMTAGIVQLSQLARNPMFLLGCGAILVVLWFAVRFLFPRFWFCVPVFGNIGRSLYTAKMLRQMANQVARNVPLPEALEQCGKTMRNSAYRKDCRSAAAAARKGMPFWEIALRYYWLFPSWLAPMLAVQQARESLAKSLRRAAETVEHQKESSILLFQSLSLPVFIILTLSCVGFFAIAMFMPLVSLISCLSA
jgi:type II secretory pathway component PulF